VVLHEVGQQQAVDARGAGEEEYGDVVGSIASNAQPVHVVGQIGFDPLRTVAHVPLDDRYVRAALELEGDANALAGGARRDGLDAGDGAQRLLDGNGDMSLRLRRRTVAQPRLDGYVPLLHALRHHLQRDVPEGDDAHDDHGDRCDEDADRPRENATEVRLHADALRPPATS
jgi:hypothetical protein